MHGCYSSGAGDGRGRGGFTLVEMLVVMVIIGLLVMIALPALARSKESARHSMCLSNQRQIGAGLFAHMVATGNYRLPVYNTIGAVLPEDVTVCPSDPKADLVPAGLFGNSEDLLLSYAFNIEFAAYGKHYQWEHVPNPSQTVYGFDGVTAPFDTTTAMATPPVMTAGLSGNSALAALASTFNSNPEQDFDLDNTDTIGKFLDTSTDPWRVDISHYPPGNPQNVQHFYNHPWPSVKGHLSHGCLPGIWPEGVNTPAERMQASFMRRHLGRQVGNVLMLDGSATPARALSKDMLLDLDGNKTGNGGGPGGGGPPGGGPPGGGPPGGGPPGGGPPGGGPPGGGTAS